MGLEARSLYSSVCFTPPVRASFLEPRAPNPSFLPQLLDPNPAIQRCQNTSLSAPRQISKFLAAARLTDVNFNVYSGSIDHLTRRTSSNSTIFISSTAYPWPRHFRVWLLNAMQFPRTVSRRNFARIASGWEPHRSGTNWRAVGPHTCSLLCTPGAFHPTNVPLGIAMVPPRRASWRATRLISWETGG